MSTMTGRARGLGSGTRSRVVAGVKFVAVMIVFLLAALVQVSGERYFGIEATFQESQVFVSP